MSDPIQKSKAHKDELIKKIDSIEGNLEEIISINWYEDSEVSYSSFDNLKEELNDLKELV